MKCIRCDNEATYIFRGMSYCKKHYKEAIDKERPYRSLWECWSDTSW